MLGRISAAFALCLLSTIALAQFNGCAPGFCIAKVSSTPPSGYVGVCDIANTNCTLYYDITAATGAIAAAGTQPLFNVRNTGTTEQCDVLPLSTGGPGNTSGCTGSSSGILFTTFCATACTVTKVYNQITATTCSSSNCDLPQSTTADQPTFVLNCIGSFPCLQTTGNFQQLISTNTFTITNSPTLHGVYKYTSNASTSIFFDPAAGTSIALDGTNTANTLLFQGFFTNLNFIANINQWHTIANSILNSTSSFAQVDGVATTGSSNGNGGTHVLQALTATAGVTISSTGWLESNSSWSQATATAVCKNRQALYGASNFGATC